MDFRLNIRDTIMCILLTRESFPEAVIFQASSGDGRRQGAGEAVESVPDTGNRVLSDLEPRGGWWHVCGTRKGHVWLEHRVGRRGKRRRCGEQGLAVGAGRVGYREPPEHVE